jgi:hypothetical protein
MTEDQEKVIKYVNARKNWRFVLVFGGITPEEEKALKRLRFDLLCLEVLKLSRIYPSYRLNHETGSTYWETRVGALRSAGDIWRHVKRYKPDATIFNVMAALYRLRTRVTSSYCGNVRRQVFRPYENLFQIQDNPQAHRSEFAVHFDKWKNIDKQ